MSEKSIHEVIEEYLTSLTDSDLLELGEEFHRMNDRDCTWTWRIEVEEEMYMRASAITNGWHPSTQSVLKAMEWAQRAKGYKYIDYEGSFMNEEDFIEQARDNIDELTTLVEDGISSYSGMLDVYESIDTDELQELIEKTDEWQENYGEEDEE